MRKHLLALLLGIAFSCSGCDDKHARAYANELTQVLKSYQAEVLKKIKAEQTSYKKLAGTYAYAKQVEVFSMLEAERLRRMGGLTDALMQGKILSPAEIQQLVGEYARLDFETTRTMFEKESDDRASYLTGIENLEFQVQNLEALIAQLEELAKPKSELAKLNALADFAKGVKDKLNVLECEDLACEVKVQEAKKKQTTNEDEKKKIQAEIDRLKKAMKTKNCADTVTCPAQ